MENAKKVLLMDDDTSILMLSKIMLERHGYQVEESLNGEEAISLYKASLDAGSKYDLLIMDLTIPGHMGAKEAIVEILKLDPEATAIVCSGYGADSTMVDYTDLGFKGMLSKPFKMEELIDIVKKCLS